MLKNVNEYRRVLYIYCIGLVGLCLEWWLLMDGLEIRYPNHIAIIFKCVGDCAFILLPYFLLKPRWRWSILLPLWMYGIWCIANLIYFRFWHDLIPPAVVTMGGNANSDLATCILSLIKPYDSWFILIPLLATISLSSIKHMRNPSLPLRFKSLFIAISVCIFLLGQTSYFISHKKQSVEKYTSLKESLNAHYTGWQFMQTDKLGYEGTIPYFIRFAIDAISQFNNKIKLSSDQRAGIDDFLTAQHVTLSSATDMDSTNVVYIIVESLHADLLHTNINGKKITPTLDSLAKLPGTIIMDNIVSQIKHGVSSDGHLLLMTGLLPPKDIAYSYQFGGSNTFHTLADVLPDHYKSAYSAGKAKFWNMRSLFKNFGLGDLITIDEMNHDETNAGADETLFKFVGNEIRSLPHPFFVTMVTMSMHIPFSEKSWEVPDFLANCTTISETQRKYYTVSHYFDKYLKSFVDSLPENTILFIASDHTVNLSDTGTPHRTLFMALNSGRTEQIHRLVGQVNLFPATLEILGKTLPDYSGLAPSALNPVVDGTIDSQFNIIGSPTQETIDSLKMAYDISDLIIRGNYFYK